MELEKVITDNPDAFIKVIHQSESDKFAIISSGRNASMIVLNRREADALADFIQKKLTLTLAEIEQAQYNAREQSSGELKDDISPP